MSITDPALLTTLQAVFSSERAMPAHFSGDDERSKTFFLDYDMSADDEYEIASQAYHVAWEFISKIPDGEFDTKDASAVIKVGEDLALGAFILTKTDEHASFSDLFEEIVAENLRLWEDPHLEEVFAMPMVRNYFDFCLWFGRARAWGFTWGKKPEGLE